MTLYHKYDLGLLLDISFNIYAVDKCMIFNFKGWKNKEKTYIDQVFIGLTCYLSKYFINC